MKHKKIFYSILLILLFSSIFFFLRNREDFAPLQKYCLSADQYFIAISDDDDPRCLKNQKKQESNSIQPILNYIPCLTKNGTWGLQYLHQCYPLSQPQQKPSPLLSQNSILSNSGFEYSGSNEISGIDLSKQKDKTPFKRKDHKRKPTCQDTKTPHSGPCFTLSPKNLAKITQLKEHFSINDQNIDCNSESFTLDEQCQCHEKDSRYGFYKVQVTGNQGSIMCRKYYKSQNNDITKEGIYSPNEYGVYIPKKGNSEDWNMTGCMPRDTDFNEMCGIKNQNENYGTYQILYGEDGNCYDPISYLQNQNYGNAICSQNHYQNIPKLWSGHTPITNLSLSPNYFTKCTPMNSNLQQTFQSECDKIELSGMGLKAYEIDSYDCPPGEARAKCHYVS